MPQEEASRRRYPALDDDGAFDVPAAILCAVCGRSDCAGCAAVEADEGSGVVAIVPWERPGPGGARFWSTCNATTQGAETLFRALPDGEVSKALGFAVVAELVAVGSVFLVLAPLGAAILPDFALEILTDPAKLGHAFGVFIGLIVGIALWMVLAHAVHGAALARGAARAGGRGSRPRGLRFGLYACGWDVMSSPAGILAALFAQGPGAALRALSLSVSAPSTATQAFLEGTAAVPPAGLAKARRAGMLSAVLIAVASGAVVLVGAALAMFG